MKADAAPTFDDVVRQLVDGADPSSAIAELERFAWVVGDPTKSDPDGDMFERDAHEAALQVQIWIKFETRVCEMLGLEIPDELGAAEYWHDVLPTRCIFFANQLLVLPDQKRRTRQPFLHLPKTQSFLGREDVNLTDKLLAERAGIFNLCLDAFDRLRTRGRFLQPASGFDIFEILTDATTNAIADRATSLPCSQTNRRRPRHRWQLRRIA